MTGLIICRLVFESLRTEDSGSTINDSLQYVLAVELSQRLIKILPSVMWSGKHLHPEAQVESLEKL